MPPPAIIHDRFDNPTPETLTLLVRMRDAVKANGKPWPAWSVSPVTMRQGEAHGLFVREGRGVRLTPTGESYLARYADAGVLDHAAVPVAMHGPRGHSRTAQAERAARDPETPRGTPPCLMP